MHIHAHTRTHIHTHTHTRAHTHTHMHKHNDNILQEKQVLTPLSGITTYCLPWTISLDSNLNFVILLSGSFSKLKTSRTTDLWKPLSFRGSDNNTECPVNHVGILYQSRGFKGLKKKKTLSMGDIHHSKMKSSNCCQQQHWAIVRTMQYESFQVCN